MNNPQPSSDDPQRQLEAWERALATLAATGADEAVLAPLRDRIAILRQQITTGGGDFVGRDKTVQGDEVHGDKVMGNKVDGDQIAAGGSSSINTGSGTAIVAHIVNLYRERAAWTGADYRAALERYLAWVCAATSKVVLRGIKRGGHQAVELPLDDVYVPLAAEALPEPLKELKRGLRQRDEPSEFEAARQITMRELLAQGERLAVIGAPGCGKTTVLQHIAWTLAEALRTGRTDLAAERLGMSDALPVPIYVPLSLYAEHRHRFANDPDPRRRQLAAFISHHLIERQAGLNLPDDFFATLLDNGQHVILLLDGLDEVPNEDERALVAQAVRELTFGRESARFVVTSRSAAYHGRAVLGGGFRTVRVLPIEPEQVADLIRRAYAAIYPADVEIDERDRRAADLIAGVKTLEAERAARLGGGIGDRLVTTPLLVRMLLIVHFNLRRLPDQRAELYMEVVDTLLTSSHNPDEAVAQRLAALGGDWRGRRDLCQHLAFHMHDRGDRSGREIGERELSDQLYGYLTTRRHRSEEAASMLVADFVATNRQRGGLMEEHAGRHRFTHLGFQEFLTARYLAEAERDVERIAHFIEKQGRAGHPWWREPILLTIGYLNLTAQDTAADLMRRLAHLSATTCPHSVTCLATVELTATAFLEWGGADTTRSTLAHHLADLLAAPGLEGSRPDVRASAGRALGRLGDPRPGVGLTAEGLPDIAWCDVPAGPFIMGSTQQTDKMAYENEAPQHTAHIDRPYRISKYPITNAQFAAFVKDGGYTERWRRCWTKTGWQEKGRRLGSDKEGGVFDLPNHPAVGVSWYEAVAFCNWLSDKLGCEVSLPTEAQWERAARGTDGRRYPWRNELTPSHANHGATGINTTSAVGILPQGANPESGVMDMSGNVLEWCRTKWRGNYKSKADEDLKGDAGRVSRGGAFNADARGVRCACRYGYIPQSRFWHFGFRVVVSPRHS